MSENGQAQERTERATPKRLQKAREKGQVPRSRELNTMAVTLTGAAGLLLFGGWMMEGLRALLVAALAPPITDFDGAIALQTLSAGVFDGLLLLGPLLLALLAAAVAGPAMLGGLVLAGANVRPKLERLNPLKGLKRVVSAQGLMELVKTLLKFIVLTSGAAMLLWLLADELLALGRGAPLARIIDAAGIVQTAALVLAGGLVLIAAIDVPFQLFSHFQRMRMTRQEVKDELKESEGNPEVRGRVRRIQQETARRRMMQDVPRADVVITNPIHFAVALRYTDRPERAPRVVAKGRGHVAAKIRELAEAGAVPCCASPLLARAIYFNTDIGAEIPTGLYLAVARVLAWVMQLKAVRAAGAAAPAFPTDLPVPPELVTGRRVES